MPSGWPWLQAVQSCPVVLSKSLTVAGVAGLLCCAVLCFAFISESFPSETHTYGWRGHGAAATAAHAGRCTTRIVNGVPDTCGRCAAKFHPIPKQPYGCARGAPTKKCVPAPSSCSTLALRLALLVAHSGSALPLQLEACFELEGASAPGTYGASMNPPW
jgi:hypothetical protein